MISVHVLSYAQRPGFSEQLLQRPPSERWSLIIEGMWWPEGSTTDPGIDMQHISGCACCSGSIALRVALARTIRQVRPDRLYILSATDEHLDRVAQVLEDVQYRTHFLVQRPDGSQA
jgi:hypothetical protein